MNDSTPMTDFERTLYIRQLEEELRQLRECPMILCPFEAQNAELKEQLAAVQAVLRSSNIPALCQCSDCRDICAELS